MSDMFKKLVSKKKEEGKSISPVHKKAKGSVLEDLMQHLGASGLDKIKGMKKVSVAADSKEGLAEGLEKASELINHEPEESEDEEMAESPEEEQSEDSPEALKAKIAELEAKLSMKKA
jgi:hypothetical protein